MNDLIALDRKNIWHPFTPLVGATETPVVTKGKGVWLYTNDGRKILDAISSWWVNLHGHTHPHIAKAIATQAATLEHVIFAGFTHEPAIRLSENLLRIVPDGQKKIFFSDNGSTAVEVGLKMAFQYWHNKELKRNKVIAIQGAYHGDTFGSMSVAERGLFTKPFDPYLFETNFIDFPNEKTADKVIKQFKAIVDSQEVAAFIFEPLVQAAGGMRIYSAEVLDTLIAYGQQHGVVCIADEVFTGFGRTGKYFASDYLVHKPDIMAVSKGITGGFLPLGVTTCSQKIVAAFESAELEKTFFHGHSYTANPLTCAAANASFELLTDPSCQESIRMISTSHARFVNSLKGHKSILDVRSLGTILAIELTSNEGTAYHNTMRKEIYPHFLKQNILLRPLGNVIYMVPPYVITQEELNHVYASIGEFLG